MIIVIASGYITKAISNFFKEIFLVFSIILSKGSSIAMYTTSFTSPLAKFLFRYGTRAR